MHHAGQDHVDPVVRRPADLDLAVTARDASADGHGHRAPPAMRLTARTMSWYPVHLQMFPLMASRTWADVGFGFSASNAVSVMRNPGVQKPHCTAPESMKACCNGLSSPADGASPSTVRTSRPAAAAAG